MKKLKIALVLISFFILRWYLLPVTSFPEGERVRITIPLLDYPEYSDTETIIKSGKWQARVTGYHEITPGEIVVINGVMTRGVIRGEVVSQGRNLDLNIGDKVIIAISSFRRWSVDRIERILPEPMASLAIGILLGVKARMPREFYDQLVSTGTLHIIAASGYNVMIVATVLLALVQKIFRRGLANIIGIMGIWGYVILSGGSASVVRAGIMASLTLLAYYLGRPTDAKRVLGVTAILMLLFDIQMIQDIGFQLSFAATAGLLYLEPVIAKYGVKNKYLAEYLYPTLAATISTLPVILWHFGRVSWISPIVNILILPIVPLVMLLSVLSLSGLSIISWILYVPLAYIVGVIRLFG